MLPSVLALVVWLAVGARVAAEPGSSRALLGGALVRAAGAPAAGAYPYAPDFNLNASAATPFARRLLSAARDESNKQRIAFAGDGDAVPLEVQRALCEGFLRGVDAAATFVTEDVDETYAAAFPLHAGGLLPVGVRGGVHHRERVVREHRALLRDRAYAHALVVARQVLQRGTRRVERRGGERRAEPH